MAKPEGFENTRWLSVAIDIDNIGWLKNQILNYPSKPVSWFFNELIRQERKRSEQWIQGEIKKEKKQKVKA